MKMKRIIPLILAIVILLATPMSVATAMSNEAQEHIESQLRRARIPNAAVAIIQDGETSYILKDSEYDTLFQIGSVSKSFTGFGVLLLEDMGLLSINDPVNQHLPWFEVNYNGTPVPHGDIAIYNLLQHTSGLTGDQRHFPTFMIETADEFISQYRGIELAFYPSSEFAYGDANYVILGLLIEAVTGLSYDEFMTQYVFRPLGLYNTFADVQNAHATGRDIGGNRLGFFLLHAWNPTIQPLIIPTGHLYSNITDMARWAGIHLGTVDISEQFSRVVQRSHEDNHIHGNPFVELSAFYAGGWEIHTENGNVEHIGRTPGYISIVRMSEDTAVVILGNLAVSPGTASQLADITLDAVTIGAFDSVGFDFYAILDIVLTVVALYGVFTLYKFMRLAAKTIKQIRGGEKVKFNSINKKWLLDPILAVAYILAVYILLPNLFRTSLSIILIGSPVGMAAVIAIVWMELVYALFGLWARVFVNPQKV